MTSVGVMNEKMDICYTLTKKLQNEFRLHFNIVNTSDISNIYLITHII